MSGLANINEIYSQSDFDLINKIGQQLKNIRLEQNLTQAMVARESGIDRTTLSLIEKGNVTSLLTIIQILRTLNKLELLEPFFLNAPQISPIKMAKLNTKQRKRASKSPIQTIKQEPEW